MTTPSTNNEPATIRVLDAPPVIEVLYVDGCPHFDAFIPHLRALLAEKRVATPVTLVRIDSDDDARAERFLGSPTVRIDGRDVEPGAADLDPGRFALQCRLYSTVDGGTTGSPLDEWILAALAP